MAGEHAPGIAGMVAFIERTIAACGNDIIKRIGRPPTTFRRRSVRAQAEEVVRAVGDLVADKDPDDLAIVVGGPLAAAGLHPKVIVQMVDDRPYLLLEVEDVRIDLSGAGAPTVLPP